jgi:hypothetical protein
MDALCTNLAHPAWERAHKPTYADARGNLVDGLSLDALENLGEMEASLPIAPPPHLDELRVLELPLGEGVSAPPLSFTFSPGGRRVFAVGEHAQVWMWMQ